MFHIIVRTKPKSCIECPLKPAECRDCGQTIMNKQDSAGVNYYKIPDKRCHIKWFKVRLENK